MLLRSSHCRFSPPPHPPFGHPFTRAILALALRATFGRAKWQSCHFVPQGERDGLCSGGGSLLPLPSPLVGEGARRAGEGAVRISTNVNEATIGETNPNYKSTSPNIPKRLTTSTFTNTIRIHPFGAIWIRRTLTS
jgi:hypothetical protein